jgi:pilus assembly protein FimV
MSDEQSQKARSGETVTTRPDSGQKVNLAPNEVADSSKISPADKAGMKIVSEKASLPKSRNEPSERSYFKQPVASSEYGTKRGDTLWEIASDNRPAQDVSVQQVMITIQRNNPTAFIGGNINRLKAGMVLNLPSAEQVYEVTRRSAVTEVGRQNDDLSYAPQIDASPVVQTPVVPSVKEDQGHLSLAASGDSEANGTDGSNLAGNGSNEVLASENVSLNKQVDSLSTQVEQLERLLEIKEQQLAQFQNNLGQSGDNETSLEADLDKVDVVETSDVVAVNALGEEPVIDVSDIETDVLIDESESVEEGSIEAEVNNASLPIIDETNEVAVADEVASDDKASSSSLLETLLATPMYLGGIALLIMGLVAGLFIRKRNQTEQKAIDALESFEFDNADETDGVAVKDSSEDHDSLSNDTQHNNEAEDISEVVEAVEVVKDDEGVKVETGDAIGEAEIYIAYGRFDQASTLLQSALDQSPDDVAVRSKLLEVYAQSGEKEAFTKEFSVLQSQGELDAVNSAKELLSSIEGGSSWLNEGQSVEITEGLDELDDLDLSLDADQSELIDEAVDTDIALSPEQDSDLDSFSDSESVKATDSELGDFSLDLGDDGFDEELDLETDFVDNVSEAAVVEEVLDTLDDAVDDLSLDLELDGLDDLSIDNLSLDTELDEEILDIPDDLELSDSLSMNDTDMSSLELDDEVLDLGDVDLGLASSDDLTASEIEIDADLSLGDELDLSASSDIELDATVGADASLDEVLDLDSNANETNIDDNAVSHSSDDDLSFITDEDEISTKLDLARAYVEMGDADGAKDILSEVMEEGSDAQIAEAKGMLDELA